MAAINDVYRNALAITPNDGADLPQLITGITSVAAGNVVVDMFGFGTSITIQTIPGIILNLHIKKVYATGTTATGVVGFY